MKIIFLTGSLNQGGAEFQLISLANLFNKKGHEVHVLALTDYDFYIDYIKRNDISYQALNNDKNKYLRVFETIRIINNHKPDVVVSYLREVSLVAMFAKMLSISKYKILVGERTSLILPKYDKYYFQFCRIADILTANSITKANYIRENFPFLNNRLKFVPNLLSLNLFQWAEVKDVPQKITKLVFVGRISREKNIANLISALALVHKTHKEWTLSLYGEIKDQAYFDELSNQIKESSLDSNIRYLGVSKDLTEVYKNADALCLISIFEGFSNVISEALASGLPVLTSNIEENAFLIANEENGFLVDRYDLEDIKSGIISLLELSQKEVREVKQNNISKAKRLFDEEQVYKTYMDFLGLELLDS